MRMRTLCAAFAALLALPALAQNGPQIVDPYARVSPSGSGAVFLVIQNHSANDDRLLSATSDVADRVELHTHTTDGNGVMQMIEVSEGFDIAAESTRALERGSDHIMLMGLNRTLKDGDTFDLTLTFERGEAVTVTVPVDNARKPGGHGMNHGAPSN
jgi:periplasmic copper chaperone A